MDARKTLRTLVFSAVGENSRTSALSKFQCKNNDLDAHDRRCLDDVDQVIVASVDSKDEPKSIEVYIFPAKEVRRRFDAAYAARVKDQQVLKDGFGMWVALHKDPRGIAASIGSGLAEQYKPIGAYPIDELLAARPDQGLDQDQAEAIGEEEAGSDAPSFGTIAEVMTWARERVATLAGVRVESVKLDLKVEY